MGEKFGLIICVWMILLWGNCLGRFVVEKNSLKLISPESIKGVYESAVGNFGVPQYGGNLVGIVVYPKQNQRACMNFDDFGDSFKFRPGALPIIVLVDRGDCFFTLKAWNAQMAGAAAILVADNRDEPLITMDSPEQDNTYAEYLQNITIPSVLIEKSLGDSIKKELSRGEMVNMNLDWTKFLPNPDQSIEYEFWMSSHYECGPKSDNQIEFVKNFKGVAKRLEQEGYTQFTPHYITWYCPEAFILSKQCRSQCINHGRYCAADPAQGYFDQDYSGKDVVIENLRQACLFKVASDSGMPWLWWDYVTDFATRCPMKENKYNKECADQIIRSLGLDLTKIDQCIGDPKADVNNPVLQAEQDAQIGEGSRGDVTISPTLLINNRHYRGNLCKGAVLKAICAGFQETIMPAVCFGEGFEANYERLENKDDTAVRTKTNYEHLENKYDTAVWTEANYERLENIYDTAGRTEANYQSLENKYDTVVWTEANYERLENKYDSALVVEKNSLRLTSPESIKGVYESAIGTFGVPPYVKTLVGTVVYPKANQRSCKNFDDFNVSFKSKPGELPTVLLVDRGDCYLALKAWYGQKAGAAAVLVADDIDEPLITIDTLGNARYVQNITIPLALITKSLGDSIKNALNSGEMVNMTLDMTRSLSHRDDQRVKYEFWTSSNYECGPKCDNQIEFVKNFKGAAQVLEQKGYTEFTPHYMISYCPQAFVLTRQCKLQCINHGRYCAPTPEQDFGNGYVGKHVMVQNLRQACLFKVANESGKPWLWWDYVTEFATRCTMKENKYTKECADQVIQSRGIDLAKIDKCIGDTAADVENPVLKAEQDAQNGNGSRGNVTELPTLVINNRQYKGKLEKGAVLKEICASFQEKSQKTEPSICFSEGHFPRDS
ncbi:hypothetical protein CCACVL1_28275 [Corchorus capsularis]|uniref:PA domain-containing protein n=1 Tax=Corchorus capsularis TaxID=210143 RepID=A0A1R3G773_COCAP|nr:hypothetical protein CCACVL1_28275 [Corchorus capsularis]